MKRTSSLLLIIIILFLTSGCSLPFLRDARKVQGQQLDPDPEFSVEQVVLSQGFQNTDPRVELVRRNSQIRLLVSPGIVRSAGMEVSDIRLEDGTYNIYLVNSSYASAKLVIPQITILLSNVSQSQADSLKFNIVHENYTPVAVNHGIVDTLNRIRSDFRIASDSYPEISLIEEENDLLWAIRYDGIYDTENLEIPVINMRLKVSTSSGKVLEYSKELVSSLVDKGTIIQFSAGRGILYSRKDAEESDSELWFHDLETGDSSLVYRTFSDLASAHLSPDNSHVALLERSGDNVAAYVVSMDDRRAVRIGMEKNLVPEQLLWNSSHEIYILTQYAESQSKVLLYDMDENKSRISKNMQMDISRFRAKGDHILLTEFVPKELNNRVLFSDGRNGFRFVDYGFSPDLLDDELGMYLKNHEADTSNTLHIFDLDSLESRYESDFDVASVNRVSEHQLLLVERLPGNNNFQAHVLYLEDFQTRLIGYVNSSRMFYNLDTDVVFGNINIPYRSDTLDIIYSMDASDIKRR